MRKLLVLMLLSAVIFQGCGGQSGSPKDVINSFLNAMKTGDLKVMKQYLTKSDVGYLEMAENMAKNFGLGDSATEKMQNEFKAKSKDASFEVKDEKINGDNATVNVAVTQNGKTETQPFELKKEDGKWKVSLMSTGLNRAGMSSEDMQKAMEGVKKLNSDSIADMLKKSQEELKKLNMDSLTDKIKSSSKDLEKLGEELKKLKTN